MLSSVSYNTLVRFVRITTTVMLCQCVLTHATSLIGINLKPETPNLINILKRVDPATPMLTLLQRVNISFSPADQLRLPLNAPDRNVTLYIACTSGKPISVHVRLNNMDTDRVLVGFDDSKNYSLDYIISDTEDGYLEVTIPMRGIYLGKSTLEVWIKETDSTESGYGTLAHAYKIVIFPVLTRNDVIGVMGIFIGMALSMMGFGFTIRWDKLKNIFNRPLVMIIGFSCQYLLMPLTAYGLGIAFDLPTNMRLALLASGCCPGGSPSNMSTMVLGGDLNLSVIMTLMSTCALIVVTPFWMMSVGNTILQEGYPDLHIQIPWRMLGIFIGLFVAPCAVGILFGCVFPRVARILSFIVRPIAVLLVVPCIIMIAYSFAWFFPYANTWQMVLAPIALVIIGDVVGFVVGLLATRDTSLALTVMVEAGIQNIAPATVILRAVLPEEDAFVALLVPLFVIMTGILLVVVFAPILFAVRAIRRRGTGKGTLEHSSLDSANDLHSGSTAGSIELKEKI